MFATVSQLVDQLSDNPAAKKTAQEIADRVKRAQAGGRGLTRMRKCVRI